MFIPRISLDLYGESAYVLQPTVKGTAGAPTGSDGPKALELSLMDILPAWGNFTDFVFSINEDMVRKNNYAKCTPNISHLLPQDRPHPELITSSGIDGTSSFTRFQVFIPTTQGGILC